MFAAVGLSPQNMSSSLKKAVYFLTDKRLSTYCKLVFFSVMVQSGFVRYFPSKSEVGEALHAVYVIIWPFVRKLRMYIEYVWLSGL